VSHIKNGWENIQCLYIKTSSSISLPIWTCDLSADVEGRWAGLTLEKKEEDEDEMSTVEAPSRSPTPGPPPKKASRKLPSSSSVTLSVAEQPPQKKVKSTKSAEDRTTAPHQATISHKEVKVKRSAEVGEKKKVKVAKRRTGGTPKGTLLGKKVGKS